MQWVLLPRDLLALPTLARAPAQGDRRAERAPHRARPGGGGGAPDSPIAWLKTWVTPGRPQVGFRYRHDGHPMERQRGDQHADSPLPLVIGGAVGEAAKGAPSRFQAPGHHVPFVNRPFESEIHGTVNFTYFCCVLLVTWCQCVRLLSSPKVRSNKCVQIRGLK